MAQRVYLLAVKRDLLDMMVEAVAASSNERFDSAVEGLMKRSEQHLAASASGKRFAAKFDEAALAAAGRSDEFARATALRPYAITTPDSREARALVTAARYAENEDRREELFAREAQRFAETRHATPREVEDEDSWSGVVEDLKKLRGMRRAALAGIPFLIDTQKTAPFGDGMQVILDETETQSIEGAELVETYSQLLGSTFGRIAGLCEPSWWLGRNFWPGLMIAAEFGTLERFTKRRLISLQQEMLKLAHSPAKLFEDVGVPGYEEVFPIGCEGYGTGLIFSPENVKVMRDLMLSRRDDWVNLAVHASGHESHDAQLLFDITFEAFDWAAEDGCALLEGDELVGAYGYR